MDMDNPRFREVFFEVFYQLPRLGPGSPATLNRALAFFPEQSEPEQAADLGAGKGNASIHLAGFFPKVRIKAVDNHQPFVDMINKAITQNGLDGRLEALCGDMGDPPVLPGSLDFIISEGAVYNAGFEKGLTGWHHLLKPKGIVMVSEAVWLTENPPAAAKTMWEEAYPAITSIADNLAMIGRAGYDCLGHFTQPRSDWWEGFYVPMQKCLDVMKDKYHHDSDALSVLDKLQEEVNTYDQSGDAYGYEYFVCQKK